MDILLLPHRDHFHVSMLGVPMVRRAGSNSPLRRSVWTTESAMAVFLYLADAPDGAWSEDMAHDFWPESGPRAARKALGTAIRRARLVVGRDIIVCDRSRYVIDRDHVTTDVDQLRTAVCAAGDASTEQARATTLDRGLASVRGLYLDGIPYAWAEHRRAAASAQVAAAAHAAGDAWASLGQWARAADRYRLALAHDPDWDPAHRGLLIALDRLGDRAHAAQHYRDYERDLERRRGVRPHVSTTMLYRLIVDRSAPSRRELEQLARVAVG